MSAQWLIKHPLAYIFELEVAQRVKGFISFPSWSVAAKGRDKDFADSTATVLLPSGAAATVLLLHAPLLHCQLD